MKTLYEVQVYLPTRTIIDARSYLDRRSRPWGTGDGSEPFSIFEVEAEPGESVEFSVEGSPVTFTAPE